MNGLRQIRDLYSRFNLLGKVLIATPILIVVVVFSLIAAVAIAVFQKIFLKKKPNEEEREAREIEGGSGGA